MAFIPAKDRVAESSTTSHASIWTVDGALDASYDDLATHLTSNGDYTFGYCIEPGVAFKTGVLTRNSATEYEMTEVFQSKGAFGSGTKEVGIGFPAKGAPYGRQSIWVDARAMKKRATSGPIDDALETATNKVMLDGIAFDPSTIEYAQFRIRMPKQWDRGQITFEFVWRHPATTTNFGVSFGLQAVALADGDAGDAAFGTAQYANDTGGTTADIYTSPESAAITVAGSPGDEELVIFQILRKADDGTNDTLAVDAVLLGVEIYINTIAGSDA